MKYISTLIGLSLEEVSQMWECKPRKVDNIIRENKHTQVYVIDEPGPGNACHAYIIYDIKRKKVLDEIYFQNGPIGEVGVNGVQIEDYYAICRHRLQGFQSGDYACRENGLSLTKLEESTFWLNARTGRREDAGTEGTNEGN